MEKNSDATLGKILSQCELLNCNKNQDQFQTSYSAVYVDNLVHTVGVYHFRFFQKKNNRYTLVKYFYKKAVRTHFNLFSSKQL